MKYYAELIVRHRFVVLVLALFTTIVLGLQLRNLAVIVDADELLPRNHPFVEVTERVEDIFGNRYTLVIGITPTTGDVYRPEILGKVLAVTEALAATPGVSSGNLQSLAARRAKDIAGNDGGMEVTRLLDRVPTSAAAAGEIAGRLVENPVYRNVLVGEDGRTAAIYVEFKKDPAGFGHIMEKVDAVLDPVRDDSVTIAVAGQPVFLAALETFSKRMAYLLPLAVVLIGLIHLEAFRTLQSLVLPLLTAVLAVVWALGIMTLAGVHLDPFNNITPILILAVAAGHAVQVLKRYYEEYTTLRRVGGLQPAEANRQAVVQSIVRVGPVMLAAGSIAALSFMSLVVFDIQSIRTFGLFAGIGILSVVVVELTFTPALRAMLPPPGLKETQAEKSITVWDRMAGFLGRAVASPRGRRRIFIGWSVAALVCLAGAGLVRVDNSLRGFFAEGLSIRQDDRTLNAALAGSNTFYVLVEGQSDDAIKDPAVLRGIEQVEAFLEAEPEIGRAVSIVDMLKQINRAMNGGDPTFNSLPDDQEMISQYLFLYSISGEPGDFDGLVDYPYRNAIIQAFVKTDSSAYVASLNERILPVIRAAFPPEVTVRLGGSITTPTAMNEVMVGGKLMNIAQICAVVFLISALLFRSVKLAAMILLPLGATALAVFGLMGWLGIPLQIATATVSALAIGIGADYAIYLTYRLREELAAKASVEDAIASTFASAGKAVMFVASAVSVGYAVLMASVGFNIHLWLGLMTALAMAVAAVSTLTLFASTLVVIKPRVVFGGSRGGHPLPRMAPGLPALVLAAMVGLTLAAPPARAETADAAAMMERSLQATKVLRSEATGRFILTNKSGQQRVRETKSVSELKEDGLNNRRLVRFLSPNDIRGTGVLTIENGAEDDDIWVYLPAMRKVRRLAAANKKDGFVGTDFSYGDVLGHPVEEWTHALLRAEELDGTPVQVVESRPLDETVARNTGYSRRVNWLRSADGVAVKTEFYDLAGDLMKVYTASDIRLVDPDNSRFQPMRQEMRNVQTGHSTVIEYSEFLTDVPIPAEQFTPRMLDRPS